VSALVAGVRAAAGHPSGPEIAADTGLATCAGHAPSGGRSFLGAVDGQSADRSGSLQLPLLFLKAVLAPAATRRSPGAGLTLRTRWTQSRHDRVGVKCYS
jgi:hypothetical protein